MDKSKKFLAQLTVFVVNILLVVGGVFYFKNKQEQQNQPQNDDSNSIADLSSEKIDKQPQLQETEKVESEQISNTLPVSTVDASQPKSQPQSITAQPKTISSPVSIPKPQKTTKKS